MIQAIHTLWQTSRIVALSNIHVSLFPSHLYIVTDLHMSTNTLFLIGFHTDSVINMHAHHWTINLPLQVFLATTHACTGKWMQISSRHRNTCLPDCYGEWPEITASLVKVCLTPRNSALLFEVQLLHQLGVLRLQKLFPSLFWNSFQRIITQMN